jgi:hypothetical protein
MKNMDVGDLRPKQVLSNSNVQVDTNQVQDQVASTSSQPNDQASVSNVLIL